jgi:hypothetical protein
MVRDLNAIFWIAKKPCEILGFFFEPVLRGWEHSHLDDNGALDAVKEKLVNY